MEGGLEVASPEVHGGPSLSARLAAEFSGTFALVLVGPGAVAATAGDATLERLPFVAGVFALVVAASLMAFGKVSGSHINPAITAATAARDGLLARAHLLYIAAQVGAALVAGLTLRLLFASGPSQAYLGSTNLGPSVIAPAGFALEVAGTFALALTALSAGRLTPSVSQQAVAVGSVLFLLIMILAPFTGASLNPARSLGPALASGFLDNLWIYLAAPLAGGILPGLTVRMAASR